MGEEQCCNSHSTTHTIFIDTSLDTHLVMIATDKDTVGDFKQKVLIEHPRCFPNIGEIKIHSLKVRRRGCFYHLSSSMFLKSAFDGVKKSWFVHVDATSSQIRCIRKPLYLEPGAKTEPECFSAMNEIAAEAGRVDVGTHQITKRVSSLNDSLVPQVGSSDPVNKLMPLLHSGNVNGGTTDVGNLGGKFPSNEHHESSSLGGNKMLESEAQRKADLVCEANEIPQMNTNCKKKKSKKRSRDVMCDDVLGEDLQSGQIVKKLRSSEKKVEDSFCYSAKAPLEEHDSGICMSSEDMSRLHKETKSWWIFKENKEEEKGTSKKMRKSKSKKDDSTNQIEDLKASKLKSLTSPVLGFTNKDDPGIEYDDSSLQLAQVIKVQETTNNMNEKAPASTSNTLLEARTKKEVVKNKGPSLSVKENKEEEKATFKKTRKSKSRKDDSANQIEDLQASKLKNLITQVLGFTNKDDQGIELEDGSLQLAQVIKVQDITNKLNEEVPTSTSNTLLEAGTKQEVVNTKVPSLSVKENKEEKATFKNMRKSKLRKDESANQIEDLQASTLKSLTSPVLGFTNKDDQGIEHEDGSLQLVQVVKVQEITNNMNEKAPASTSNTLLEAGTKQEDVNTKGASLLVKKKEEVEKASSKKTRKSKSKKDGSVNQIEASKASTLKSMDTLLLEYGDKDNQVSGHEDDSLQLAQVGRVQEIRNDIDDKAPASTSKTFLDAGMKQLAVNAKDSSLSIKEDKEQEKETSKKMRKSKSKRDSSVNQYSNKMPEAEYDSGFRTEPLQSHRLSGNVGSPQAPSVSHECNVAGQHLVNGYKDGANDYTVVPRNDGEVNFKDYFVHKDDNNEVVAPAEELVEKEVQDRKYDEELKVNKKAKKRNVHSTSASSDLEESRDSINTQRHKKKSQSDTPDTLQLQQSNRRPRPNLSAIFTAGQKVKKSSADQDKNEDAPHKVSRNKIIDSSEDVMSASAVQFRYPTGVSVHTSSKVNGVPVGKSHRKEAGDVLNKSENQKSLLAASNTIFSECSTESSEDNFEVDKYISDASTRTPSNTSSSSDHLSSSDHSEGENEVNLKSPGNGSYGQKIKENGINSSIRRQVAAQKTMALNTILRSSRSYKKAKLTASQSQPEDTENQPIQFDLDS